MQSNRAIVLGLVATALAAAGIWFVARGDDALAPSPASTVAEQPLAPAPAAGPVEGGSNLEATDPAKDLERIAVAAGNGVDERRPGFTGIVVGPDGRALAGAIVSVAPGLGFGNANAPFDPQSFDASAFEDVAGGGFDPAAMLRTVREQLKDRVEVATDREGRFRVVAKGASRAVGLRVLARGHGVFDRRFDRPKDQDLDVGTLTLQSAAIVAGRVLTPDGAPVAGARVGRMLEVEQRLLGGMEFDVPEMGEVEALRGDAAITDELGQFELAHIAPGALTLRARHPEHPTATSSPLAIEAGRELRSVVLTMQVGGVITGVVHALPADSKGLQVMAAKKPKADAADPLAGTAGMAVAPGLFGNLAVNLDEMMNEAGINFGERSATIAADGRFELRGLARDTYRVWVARTGTGFAGSTVCSARVEAAPGSSVELQFEAGVTVTFTVANAKTDAPVDHLIVRDRLRGSGGVADLMGGMAAMGGLQGRRPAHYPNGAVTVANLRPKANQKLTLTVEALGYAKLERGDLDLPKVGNLDLGVLKLEPVPVVTVTVASAADGRPVEGASVRLAGNNGPGNNGPGNNPGGGPGRRAIPREFRRFMPGGNGGGFDSGRTDREGRITLNRPLQAATIEVDAKGFAPFASASIAFSAEGPEAFAAQLHLGGAVAVTVCEPADKPVAGALVEHRSPDGDIDEKRTDDQGIARFEHLPAGAHQFRLGKEGGGLGRMMSRFGGRAGGNGAAAPATDEAPWQSLDVADKAALALRLVKQPTAMVRGVVRENGVPLPGARVAFREGAPASGGDPMADGLGALAERFGDRAGGAAGGNNRSPRTDEQGLYQLRELPAGQHHLSITHKSRAMPVAVTIVLRDGENVVDVDLDMTTLRGIVKDGQGQPVDGATIRVQRPRAGGDAAGDISGALESFAPGLNLGGGNTIKTDASGAYEVRGIDPDVELELSASAKGFATATNKVTAARGTTTSAPDLVLAAAGKVRITVAGNQPFGAVRARWAGPGEGTAPVLGVVRGGKSTLEGLRPGLWEISVESAGDLNARFGGRFGRRQGQGQPDGQPQQPATPQQKRTVEVVAGQTVDVAL